MRHVDAAHRGLPRAVAAPLGELLHGAARALEVRLDLAVGAVGRPARHAEPAGLAPCGVAEEHALHMAGDHDVASRRSSLTFCHRPSAGA